MKSGRILGLVFCLSVAAAWNAPSFAGWGTNMERVPSAEEVLGRCDASITGLQARIPAGFAPVAKRMAEIAAKLGPEDQEAKGRLRFSDCSWVRNIAYRCLEPINRDDALDRMTSPDLTGRLDNDDEDDCLQDLAAKREAALAGLLKAADTGGLGMRKAIERLIPPVAIFGVYKGQPRTKCLPGDPQAIARDPWFDDAWLDCSQGDNEIHVYPGLGEFNGAADSLSNVEVQVGIPAGHGTDRAFAGSARFTGNLSMTAESEMADRETQRALADVCWLSMQFADGKLAVRFLTQDKVSRTGCEDGFDYGQPFHTEYAYTLAPADPPPFRGDLRDTEMRDYDDKYGHVRVWLMPGDTVATGWLYRLQNPYNEDVSSCRGMPSYDDMTTFFATFQKDVVDRNVPALAKRIVFPLQIDPAGTQWIKDQADLAKNLDRAFPEKLTKVVADLDPLFIYCEDGHVMAIAGRIWARPDAQGMLHVYFVDSTAQPAATPTLPFGGNKEPAPD